MNPEAVDDFLTELRRKDAERFALVDRTRELIHTAGPRLREEVRYGGLLFSAKSPVCALFSYEKHLALEFSRGSELADPHQVLEGDQGKRRHIKLQKLGDLFKKNVREYLEHAFAAEAAEAAARGKKPRR